MTTKLNVGADNSLKNGLLIDINDYYIPGPNGTKFREITAEDIDAIEENNFEEDKISYFDAIRDGSRSLKKTTEIFSSRIPKLNEERIEDLKECSLFIGKLIEAKKDYYASKGLLGKILAIFSHTFGSIKDATYLKHKIDSLRETQETQENIANSLSVKLSCLEPTILEKQRDPKIQKTDFEKLIKKYEDILVCFKMFSKENNEKHKEIMAHSIDFLNNLF